MTTASGDALYEEGFAAAVELLTEFGYDVPFTRREDGNTLNFTAKGISITATPNYIHPDTVEPVALRAVFTGEVELRDGDRIMRNGKKYILMRPEPVQPANRVLVHRCEFKNG